MKPVADIILHNGKIITQDENCPSAHAVAISGNLISDLGSDKEILSHASRDTKIINLEKKIALPGFIDTHFHFYEWALNYDSIDFAKFISFV